MTQKIFSNFTSFYEFTLQHPWAVEGNAHVDKMRSLIREMNTQCSCKRKKYISKIEAVYRSLEHNLSTPEKMSIKQAANATQVHLQQKGKTFLTM
jgi:uncharacterized protein (DUF2267 family)